MKTIKALFSSARNAVLSVLCAVVILAAVGVGIALAADARTDSVPMDRAAALRFALADAGLTEEEITVTKQKLDQKNGRKCYEIEFFTSDYEYEYEIDASTGAVTGVSIEALFGRPAAGDNAGAGNDAGAGLPAQSQTQPDAGQSGQENPGENQGQDGNQSQGEDQSQSQGGDQSQSTGSQSQSGNQSQGGNQSQSTGNQSQGGNQSQSTGSQSQSGNQSQTGSQGAGSRPAGQITLDEAKAAALADAGVSASDAVFTKAKADWDDGIAIYEIEFYTAAGEYEYELDAATGAVLDRDVEMFQIGSSQPPVSGSAYIGVDQAKEAAAGHAGCAVSGVTFTKAKLERDDGIDEYEIEFYVGCMEYEYCIDAYTGAVLKHECESEHYRGCPHSSSHDAGHHH